MTKVDIVDIVCERLGLSHRAAQEAVEATLAAVKEALQNGEPVKIVAFGSFSVRQKRARMGRNPKTSQAIVIQPRKVLTFKPSRFLRDVVNTEEVF
jgi:integration host factor subunit alpha